MAKKAVAKKIKQLVTDEVIHPPFIRTQIPANRASAAPPLGTMLGQRGINIAQFCKDYNELTSEYKDGLPMQTIIHVNPDRTYNIQLFSPPIPFLIRQAAGVRRAAMQPGNEVAGIINLKQVYEIAKFKSEEELYAHLSLRTLCIQVITEARRGGIKVINRDLDAKEYEEFLAERKAIEEQQLKEISEKRAAKLMRTSAAATATTTTGTTKK